MRLWVWRHMRVELPEDWEMLQFSRDSRTGRCAWADRYQFRFEIHWRQAESVPDVDRLASDYLARLKLEKAQRELRPPTEAGPAPETAEDAIRCALGPWQGVEGRQGGVGQASRLPAGRMPAPLEGALWTSRFARHFGEASCLVELILLWPEGRDESLQRAIVQSVAVEPRRADGLERWRAFGMDLLAAGGLALEACKIDPGWARMVFSSASPERRATFERLGMLSEWLEGSVRDWLRRQTVGTVAVEDQSTRLVNGHSVETLSGRWRPRWFSGLFGRAAAFSAAAWICPTDGRLYHVSTMGPAAGGETPLAGGRLVCCEALCEQEPHE